MNDQPTPPSTPVDSGSQALAEALRSSFAIVKFVMGFLILLFLFSGFFQVKPQEKAIILRFGKPVGEGDKALLGPGLHWSWPYPIDEVVKIPITEIQKVAAKGCFFFMSPEQEVAFQASGAVPQTGGTLNPAVDGYALTADGNIVHTMATLSYRIEDPVRCVFEFAARDEKTFSLAGVSNAVLNALDNALIRSAASYKVDDLLFTDVVGFQDTVRRRVTKLIAEQRLGLVVDQCIVQSRPPRQLTPAFANVVMAGQRSRTVLDDARSYENQVLSHASAEATNRINVAETERVRIVQSVTSDAETFRRLLPKYEANPQLFVQQRVVETMGRVFTNATDKMYLPSSADGKPVELRLLLNREPPKQKTEEPKP